MSVLVTMRVRVKDFQGVRAAMTSTRSCSRRANGTTWSGIYPMRLK